MKWYFALSAASIDSPPHDWRSLIRVAVHTALQNTTLQPHLIWDGPDHPFVQEMRDVGVTVIFHRVPFYDELEAHQNNPVYLATAAGCFLRVEIPMLEPTDDFVLYTDADVMFLRDPAPLLSIKPQRFAAAPEFTPEDNLNSGVMLLNIRQMRADYPGFAAFIRGNLHLGLDQEMYRNYYAGYYHRLDPGCNWKPYWGVREDACILHWHGIKPADATRYIADETYGVPPELAVLIQRDRAAYQHYLAVFQDRLAGYGAAARTAAAQTATARTAVFHRAASGFQADLGAITTIRQLRLTATPAASRRVALEVSIDGRDWVAVFAGISAFPLIWDGPGSAWARHIRVVFQDSGAPVTAISGVWV